MNVKHAGKTVWRVIKQAGSDWSADNAPRMGAALAYYTVFALAPLLVLIIAIAGFFYGQEAAQGELFGHLRSAVGTDASAAIEDMIANARKPAQGIVATGISILMLLIGASGLFGELQSSLNLIWEVKPRPGRGIKGIIQDRFLSFAMIITIGFLLVVSLVVSTILAAVGIWVQSIDSRFEALWQVVNLLTSFGIITVLFALMFKVLPDVKVAWRDVWVGAGVTSLLFAIGKVGISLYLSKSTVASVYGAAGSLAILLIWTYYSAQIFLFGGEITQAWSEQRTGHRPELKKNAEWLTPEEKVHQGVEVHKAHRPENAKETASKEGPELDEGEAPAVDLRRPLKLS